MEKITNLINTYFLKIVLYIEFIKIMLISYIKSDHNIMLHDCIFD